MTRAFPCTTCRRCEPDDLSRGLGLEAALKKASQSLISERWDAEYRRGRYADAPPLPFVDRIVATLRARGLFGGAGLYVGCGNGRNYVPLVKSGLRLYGLDLSAASLRQLATREPELSTRLVCADFRTFASRRRFSYVISIQVFQHGVAADVARYFSRVGSLLAPGGIFFLRVNATSTQIRRPHTTIERNDLGGFTVRYEAGSKHGLPVHFYTCDELHSLTCDDFAVVAEPREDVTVRAPPEAGHWVQWEAVWRRLEDR